MEISGIPPPGRRGMRPRKKMSLSDNSSVFRIVVLLSGRGSNFRAIQEALKGVRTNARIVCVLSDRPKAQGLEYAASEGLPVRVVSRRIKERTLPDFHRELEEVIASENPDLVVLAGFMRVLPPELVRRFEGRIVNIHPSLLPSFRGLDAQGQALRAGVALAGCSVHYVTEELDGGPIIGQAAVPVFADDTEETLSERILRQEHRIYPRVVLAIASGEISLSSEGKVVRPKNTLDGSSGSAQAAAEEAILSLR
jgi:phosphoribosylglycinamide formyltransferase-1